MRAPAKTRVPGRAAWVAVALIVICAALIRVRLLDIPLERDEGEYAYAGQLMLRGIPPYQLAWNMKLPGTYAAYAVIMAVLGQSIRAIHLGLLAVNAFSTVLVYLIAGRWFRPSAAAAASGAFALLSMGAGVLGMAGHATHFVIAFALAATLALFQACDRASGRRLFLSGLLFGMAVLMKQQGAFFGLFGGVWLIRTLVEARTPRRPAVRRLLAFGLGCALPLAVTFLVLWKAGVFERFWFWTFTYAREYASELTPGEGFQILRRVLPKVVTPNIAIWAMAAAGLALMWATADRMRTALPVTLFLVFSLLAVCPGFYFREHYFVLMLPAVALLSGAAVDWALGALRGSSALLLWGMAMAGSLALQSGFLFLMSPVAACRAQYGLNPFPEAIEVARYIRAATEPGSRIAVIGSEPEIYFYAGRLPATGYMYTYGLMEPQPFAVRMQSEMAREIEASRPEYVIVVAIPASWLTHPDSSRQIFEWWNSYVHNYTQTGLIDIVSANETNYSWGADAHRMPLSPMHLLVLRRRGGATGLR